MGLIYSGVPKKLVAELAGVLKIDLFIETGTYYGDTAIWASKLFKNVITIEASENIFEKSHSKIVKYSNITHLFGISSSMLSELKINQPAIYWLDAHYSGGDTFNGENPLLKEIEVINSLDPDSVVIIDDARFITSVWVDEHYCELSDLIMTLTNKNRYITIFDDVIIIVPRYAKYIVDNFTNERSKVLWNEYLKRRKKKRRLFIFDILNAFKRVLLHQSIY